MSSNTHFRKNRDSELVQRLCLSRFSYIQNANTTPTVLVIRFLIKHTLINPEREHGAKLADIFCTTKFKIRSLIITCVTPFILFNYFTKMLSHICPSLNQTKLRLTHQLSGGLGTRKSPPCPIGGNCCKVFIGIITSIWLVSLIVIITNFKDEQQSSIIDALLDLPNSLALEPSTSESRTKRLLGCQDMKNVEITNIIATGNKKIIYEVKLPSGQPAVVKRCLHIKCMEKYMARETYFLKKLQETYGRSETIAFYGECNMPYDREQKIMKKLNKEKIRMFLSKVAPHFDVSGITSLVEKGDPLIVTNGKKDKQKKYRNCIASHFQEADLENFRTIARQYAGYPEHPILFNTPNRKYNSHAFPEQYVLVRAGIRHVDLDNLFKCPECTYDEALEVNCKTVRLVTDQADLNCTQEYSLHHQVKNRNLHINPTEANLNCMRTMHLYTNRFSK